MSLLLENPPGKTKKTSGTIGAGRALKIGSSVFDFFFFLLYTSFLPIFHIKVRVQMESKWAGDHVLHSPKVNKSVRPLHPQTYCQNLGLSIFGYLFDFLFVYTSP